MHIDPTSFEGAAFIADHAVPGVRIIPQTPDGHREIRRLLAGLGTLGRDERRARITVQMSWAMYRNKQRVFAKGWNGRGDGTLAHWRSNVRKDIAALRAISAQLEAV